MVKLLRKQPVTPLRLARMRLAVTGAELAATLDVDRSTITLWEQGLRTPDAAMRAKVAKLLKSTPDELWPHLAGDKEVPC